MLADHVPDLTALEAAHMVVVIGATVVTRWAATDAQLTGHTGLDEGLQRLVDRRQADVRQHLTHLGEDLVGGGVCRDTLQITVDRRPLRGVPVATRLKSRSQPILPAAGWLDIHVFTHPIRCERRSSRSRLFQ